MQDYGSYLPEELKISADKNLRTLGDRMDIFDYVYLSFEEVTLEESGIHIALNDNNFFYSLLYSLGL